MPSFLPRIADTSDPLEPDLDVDAGGQRVEPLQRVDGFRRRLEDVDQTLVRADLEVLAGVLVLERRTDDAVDVFLGGQGHGTGHGGTGALGRLDDLARSTIDRVMVVGLEPDSNFLCRYGCHWNSFSLLLVLGRKEGGAPCCWGAAPVVCLCGCPPRRAVGAGVTAPPLGTARRFVTR